MLYALDCEFLTKTKKNNDYQMSVCLLQKWNYKLTQCDIHINQLIEDKSYMYFIQQPELTSCMCATGIFNTILCTYQCIWCMDCASNVHVLSLP